MRDGYKGNQDSTLQEYTLVVFTTQLQIAVVDGHVSRKLHIAPGALRVVVRVTALVSRQADLRDEVLVYAEGLGLPAGPLQTGVTPQGDGQVTNVVHAVIEETRCGSGWFRGHSGRDKVLTFEENQRLVVPVFTHSL